MLPFQLVFVNEQCLKAKYVKEKTRSRVVKVKTNFKEVVGSNLQCRDY